MINEYEIKALTCVSVKPFRAFISVIVKIQLLKFCFFDLRGHCCSSRSVFVARWRQASLQFQRKLQRVISTSNYTQLVALATSSEAVTDVTPVTRIIDWQLSTWTFKIHEFKHRVIFASADFQILHSGVLYTLHGFPGLFTDTSEHIRFFSLLFLFSTVSFPRCRLILLM